MASRVQRRHAAASASRASEALGTQLAEARAAHAKAEKEQVAAETELREECAQASQAQAELRRFGCPRQPYTRSPCTVDTSRPLPHGAASQER